VTGWAVVAVGYTLCAVVWACYVIAGHRGDGGRR
jgi:hypothetical protein